MANNFSQHVLLFQKKIFLWFRGNGRKLPWRETRDPYAIVVSEIMLQQTQVDRVVIHFPRWLKRFPTWHHLARAQQKSVVRQWSGMGYNRRAIYLHKLARAIVVNDMAQLPHTVEALQKLPGIGAYTAHALMAFVWRKPSATADVNINRLLHRFFLGAELPQARAPAKKLLQFANDVYPRMDRNHVAWNHALMDFGALICTARDPHCTRCPLAAHCKARPIIHKRIQSFYKNKKVFSEPGVWESEKFIPNRIFRGRIVEYLRTHPTGTISVIGGVIKNDYSARDELWLCRLLIRLEDEGMLQIRNNRVSLR